MKAISIEGQQYRLPGMLNPFQQEMYVHLIDWKWAHITREPGIDRGHVYDAILPEQDAHRFATVYPDVVPALKAHRRKYPFRIHKFFHHMASSQAANINLFLPILLHPRADAVLAQLKPDFARLAVSQLDHGYRIEFWDEPFGNLHDKSKVAGTDTDIAIAYYNPQDELCLWLIEHKLTESEFTRCGGARSHGRQPKHDCSKSFSDILADKGMCYYHDKSKFAYWDITGANLDFFPNHNRHIHCPFQGGMNQLWRNQLLGLSIEQDERQPFRHVTFSVVRHTRNTYLDHSLAGYRELIGDNSRLSVFTSADVVAAAITLHDAGLDRWTAWYRELYAL